MRSSVRAVEEVTGIVGVGRRCGNSARREGRRGREGILINMSGVGF